MNEENNIISVNKEVDVIVYDINNKICNLKLLKEKR